MQNSSPIAEVFGFPISNETEKAKYYRENRLCPFHNRFPNCTKDKADNPLGVCSVNHGSDMVITCPSRFREDWKILQNAAAFVWPKGIRWTSLPEIKLVDANGQSAGNVDYVIVSYNEEGQITDPKTTKKKADIAWFLYDLKYSETDQCNHLVLVDIVYIEFQSALEQVIYTKPGQMSDFLTLLQGKLDERISNEPETRSVYDLL